MTGTGEVSRRPSASPRADFNSAGLVRLLGEMELAGDTGVADSKQGFAERLSLWLDWTDAISLSAALDAGSAVTPRARQATTPSSAHAAVDEFIRVRAALAQAIAADDLFVADKPGVKAPSPKAGAAVDTSADFSPFRRGHVAHQRAMTAGIGPLRARVRAALTATSPALGQLAALDAAMDDALAARERQLLGNLPALLERHFKRLSSSQTQAQAPAPADTAPGQASWLAVFRRDMRAVLLAELDLRLLPVEGMIEAIRDEASGRQ